MCTTSLDITFFLILPSGLLKQAEIKQDKQTECTCLKQTLCNVIVKADGLFEMKWSPAENKKLLSTNLG